MRGEDPCEPGEVDRAGRNRFVPVCALGMQRSTGHNTRAKETAQCETSELSKLKNSH